MTSDSKLTGVKCKNSRTEEGQNKTERQRKTKVGIPNKCRNVFISLALKAQYVPN